MLILRVRAAAPVLGFPSSSCRLRWCCRVAILRGFSVAGLGSSPFRLLQRSSFAPGFGYWRGYIRGFVGVLMASSASSAFICWPGCASCLLVVACASVAEAPSLQYVVIVYALNIFIL